MGMDGERLETAIRGALDEDATATEIVNALQAIENGSGKPLMKILVGKVFDAVAAAVAAQVVSEITGHAVVTVPIEGTDAGLQVYINAGGAPTPTTGPLAPTSLDGSVA